jgi:hypothetical protein
LSEQGDVRGRLIGLEHRLASARLSADQQHKLQSEIDELVAANQGSWSVSEVPDEWAFEWRHGFIVGLALPLDEVAVTQLGSFLADPGTRLLMSLRVHFAREPDENADFDENYQPKPVPAELLQALFELDLSRVRALAFEYAPLGAAGVELLASWPGLAQLRSLDLRYNELGDPALEPLLASGRLAELRELRLQRNRLRTAGASALASASQLDGLTLLDLRDNPIGPAGAAALAASTNFGRLQTLYLYHDDVGLVGACALAESQHLPLHIRRYWAGQWRAANDRASSEPTTD